MFVARTACWRIRAETTGVRDFRHLPFLPVVLQLFLRIWKKKNERLIVYQTPICFHSYVLICGIMRLGLVQLTAASSAPTDRSAPLLFSRLKIPMVLRVLRPVVEVGLDGWPLT